MRSSVRVRRSVLLSVAFAGLLLIIGASAFAIWRNATAAQVRVAALHSAHLDAGNALSALRANVYLTAVLTRDYLLDPDPNHARQYADQFVKIRIVSSDSFRILTVSAQGDQEKAALDHLHLEVETYLDPTRIALDLTLARRTLIALNFCASGCAAGEEIVTLASQVERMMTDNFARERERVTKADQDFPRLTGLDHGAGSAAGNRDCRGDAGTDVGARTPFPNSRIGAAAFIRAGAHGAGAGAEIPIEGIARSGGPDADGPAHGVVEHGANLRGYGGRVYGADRACDEHRRADAAGGARYRHAAAALHAGRSGVDSGHRVVDPGNFAIERTGN